ncbi:hypothetical protein [Nitrosarchaeum sp.]|uniref:hypothetical protein n=1 Tax=Nitrosarchaeum sp. TaxID=2026886 RepID=UPI00247BFD77|nr:hypothetical protein [Nitrosarchaeum sp.]MCV0412760.1 hypothetical protein [Nitrosarchaeum sp.]
MNNKIMSFGTKASFGIALFLILSIGIVGNLTSADAESPRKQMKRGVSVEDISCKDGLSLVIRNNGSPACVSVETADRMEKRGLGEIEVRAAQVTTNSDVSIKDLEKTTTPIKKQESVKVVPASTGSVINFYIQDDDLNVAHNGVETVSTAGLFEFTINGISIDGPPTMIETGPNTGEFYVKLQLPDTINGRPLSQNDVVLIKYLDASDYSGDKQTITQSVSLSKSYANVEAVGGGSRIGHEFTLRIYEPDANRDSKNEDKISLSQFEFRGEGGIRTSLSNSDFDANSNYLIETGKNTNIFEVKIKIPRTINGKTIHIGDEYEIRYIDSSTPSGSSEKIVLKGRIG